LRVDGSARLPKYPGGNDVYWCNHSFDFNPYRVHSNRDYDKPDCHAIRDCQHNRQQHHGNQQTSSPPPSCGTKQHCKQHKHIVYSNTFCRQQWASHRPDHQRHRVMQLK